MYRHPRSVSSQQAMGSWTHLHVKDVKVAMHLALASCASIVTVFDTYLARIGVGYNGHIWLIGNFPGSCDVANFITYDQ